MLAGHCATALVAHQRAPTRRLPKFLLVWYLGVSQLPDLLWLLFHVLGLEPTQPTDLFDVTLQGMSVDMMFSHDLLPIIGWGVLFGLLGTFLFRAWQVGLATAVLVGLHAGFDYLGGYPHHVFGPETPVIGTGMYLTFPFVAIALEALYIAVFVGWFFLEERRRGIVRTRNNRRAIIGLFVFNLVFLASIAVTSMRDWFGLPEFSLPFETTVPSLVITYILMGVVLWRLVQSHPNRDTQVRSL